MRKILGNGVSVDRHYTVTEMDPVRDSVGCPLDPTAATVRFHAYCGAEIAVVGIEIEGRRLRGLKTKGTMNRAYFSVRPDGTVKPHHKYGEAPVWVWQVVSQAIAEHGAGLVPTTAGADPVPTFSIRADSSLGLHMLNTYRDACKHYGYVEADAEAALAFDAFAEWQQRNPASTPSGVPSRPTETSDRRSVSV